VIPTGFARALDGADELDLISSGAIGHLKPGNPNPSGVRGDEMRWAVTWCPLRDSNPRPQD
jgi:hypothetical protein